MAQFVKTNVLKVNPQTPEPHIIRQAVDTLRRGRLVAFPTETVYGLGANALDSTAIARIYAAKNRPTGDPIIAHIYEIAQLEMLAVGIPPVAYTLAERFWPGPLTLVLYRAPGIPYNIAVGRNTIAVRMPAHPVALALLKAADAPIVAPSANAFSRPSATTAAHVLEDLDGLVDLILDGGEANIGMESTVLDLTAKVPQILRPGGLTIEELCTILPEVVFAPRYVTTDAHESSPGQMQKHYAPKAQLMLFQGDRNTALLAMEAALEQHQAAGRRVGVMVVNEDADFFKSMGKTLPALASVGPAVDLATIGHNLFAAMRDLDARGVDVILARDFGQTGLGTTLWDRLLRAAEGNVIKVD